MVNYPLTREKRVATQLQNQLGNTLVLPANAPPAYNAPLFGVQQQPQQQSRASSIAPPEGSTRTVTPEGNVVYTLTGSGSYLVPRYEQWLQNELYRHRSWEEQVSFNYLQEEYTYSPSGELISVRKFEPGWREQWGGRNYTQQYEAPFGSRVIEYTTYVGDQPATRTEKRYDAMGQTQFKTFTNFAEGTVKQKKFDLQTSYTQGVTPKGIYVPVGKNTVLVTGAQGAGLYKSGGWQTVVGVGKEGEFYGTTYNPGRVLMESFYAKEYGKMSASVDAAFDVKSFGADPALFGMLGEATVREREASQREAWRQAYREGQVTQRFGFEGGMSLASGEEVTYNPVVGAGQALSGEARVISNPFKPGLVTTIPYGQQLVVSVGRTGSTTGDSILPNWSSSWLDSAQKKYDEWKQYVNKQSARGNLGFKAVEYATAGGEFAWETINPPRVVRGSVKAAEYARTIPGSIWDVTSSLVYQKERIPTKEFDYKSKSSDYYAQVWGVRDITTNTYFKDTQSRIKQQKNLSEQFISDPDVWQAGMITGGIAASYAAYPFFIGRVGLTALGAYGTYEQAKVTIKNPTPKNIMGTVIFALPTGMEAIKVGKQAPGAALLALRRTSPAAFDSLMAMQIRGKRVGSFVPIEDLTTKYARETGDFQRVKNRKDNIRSTFEEFQETRGMRGGVFALDANDNIKWVSATGFGVREGKSLGILPGLASDAERARFIAQGAPKIGQKWTFRPERRADDPGLWASAYRKASLYFLRVGAQTNYGGISILPSFQTGGQPALIVGTADRIVGLPKNIRSRPIYRKRPGGGLTVEEYERQYKGKRTLVIPRKSYRGSGELQAILPYDTSLANVGMGRTWIGDLLFKGKADYFTIWRDTIIPIQKLEPIEVLSANMNRALITTGGTGQARSTRRIGGTLSLPDYTQTLPQQYKGTTRTPTGKGTPLLESQKKLTYSSTGDIQLTKAEQAQYSGLLRKYGSRSSLQYGAFGSRGDDGSYAPTPQTYTGNYMLQYTRYGVRSTPTEQYYAPTQKYTSPSSYYYAYRPRERITTTPYKPITTKYKTRPYAYKTPPTTYRTPPTTYRYGYKMRVPKTRVPRTKKLDFDLDFGGKITTPKRKPTTRKTKYQPSYRAIDLGIKAPKGFNKKYYTLIGVEERGQ